MMNSNSQLSRTSGFPSYLCDTWKVYTRHFPCLDMYQIHRISLLFSMASPWLCPDLIMDVVPDVERLPPASQSQAFNPSNTDTGTAEPRHQPGSKSIPVDFTMARQQRARSASTRRGLPGQARVVQVQAREGSTGVLPYRASNTNGTLLFGWSHPSQ